MFIFIKIGYKNLFRNKRRSVLTSIVIGLGLASMIITDGFMDGMSENMVKTITTGMVTEGQVHNPLFSDSFDAKDVIMEKDKVEKILSNDAQVENYAKRVISFAMLSSARNMRNITVYGVDPEKEKQVTTTYKYVSEGKYVEDEQSLLVGSLLLERLEVELGDKVVLTVAEAHSGELSQVLLRISGVLTAGSKEMDENAAFIHIKKAQSIFNIGQNYHEIAIKFRDRSVGEQETYPLWAQLNHTGNKGESWKGIVASFTEIMGMVDQSKGIMAFILMLLVGVGIVNTLFMSIYERMFEFAVLRALGTKSREIIIMVMSEAGAMAVMSVVLGLIITVILALPLGLSGIDYGGMEFADVTIREPIFYEFHWSQITSFPVATFMFTVLISIYPAYHAAKVTMAQAIKKTL